MFRSYLNQAAISKLVHDFYRKSCSVALQDLPFSERASASHHFARRKDGTRHLNKP